MVVTRLLPCYNVTSLWLACDKPMWVDFASADGIATKSLYLHVCLTYCILSGWIKELAMLYEHSVWGLEAPWVWAS